MRALLPKCERDGCDNRVKQRWRVKGKRSRWCSVACVPRAFRAEAGRRGRLKNVVERRLALFRGELQRLQSLEKITGQELTATFATIHGRAWDNGYACCESKWLKRPRKKKAA